VKTKELLAGLWRKKNKQKKTTKNTEQKKTPNKEKKEKNTFSAICLQKKKSVKEENGNPKDSAFLTKF